jgi:hypothetical protein
MTALDLNRAWALFISDPAYFIAIFAIVAGAAFGCAWWLRHFIGKERIATLEERLQLAKDKYDGSTADVQRLTAYSSRLESEVAKLEVAFQKVALPSPVQPQLDAVRATSVLMTRTVTDLSTANSALGVVLTGVGHSAGTGTAHGVSEEVRPPPQPGPPEIGSPELKTTTTKPSA